MGCFGQWGGRLIGAHSTAPIITASADDYFISHTRRTLREWGLENALARRSLCPIASGRRRDIDAMACLPEGDIRNPESR